MKIGKRIILIVLVLLMLFSNKVLATEEIIHEQIETLNIYELINEGEKYTKENFPDLDLLDLFENTILGKVDNENLYTYIVGLAGQEIKNTFTLLRRHTGNYCNT